MKRELIDIEVTRYNEYLEEVTVEEGKATREDIQAFINRVKSGEKTDVLAISAFVDGEWRWDGNYWKHWKHA